MEGPGRVGGLGSLTEGCISHILSFTSPTDACRSAAVCRGFRSAAESDAVWEGFLPAGYRDILARADNPVEFRSKKELYSRLCRPLLIDNGRKSFALEKPTGKKCYMLSPKDLQIVWTCTPQYWSWRSLPESRFSEVPELHGVCWLEIRGRLSVSMLSPETIYMAYLVYGLTSEAEGLSYPCETSVTVGPCTSRHLVRLQTPENPPAGYRPYPEGQLIGAVQIPVHDRNDGWKEVALGEFVVGKMSHGEVDILLLEIRGQHWKRGLIVEGIEVRPSELGRR